MQEKAAGKKFGKGKDLSMNNKFEKEFNCRKMFT